MSLTVFIAICVLGLDFMIFVLFQWLYGEKNRNRFCRSAARRHAAHSQTPLYYVSSRGNSQRTVNRTDLPQSPAGRASCINQIGGSRGSNGMIVATTGVSQRPLPVDMHELRKNAAKRGKASFRG